MTKKEAQKRISDGLSVHARIVGKQQRHRIKSIGLTICHTIENQRLEVTDVEFTT
jgi:hypothetical protein